MDTKKNKEDFAPYTSETHHDLIKLVSYHIGILYHHLKEITKILENHATKNKEDTNGQDNRTD